MQIDAQTPGAETIYGRFHTERLQSHIKALAITKQNVRNNGTGYFFLILADEYDFSVRYAAWYWPFTTNPPIFGQVDAVEIELQQTYSIDPPCSQFHSSPFVDGTSVSFLILLPSRWELNVHRFTTDNGVKYRRYRVRLNRYSEQVELDIRTMSVSWPYVSFMDKETKRSRRIYTVSVLTGKYRLFDIGRHTEPEPNNIVSVILHREKQYVLIVNGTNLNGMTPRPPWFKTLIEIFPDGRTLSQIGVTQNDRTRIPDHSTMFFDPLSNSSYLILQYNNFCIQILKGVK
jgi:hypothetical protein